jgi:glycosyltransferase involved in cell wall biosynthesis
VLNAVMVVRNRPRLTHQTLESFIRNSNLPWNLVVVDDASDAITSKVLRYFADNKTLLEIIRVTKHCGVIGKLKNLGIYWSEKVFGRGEWLYVMDNDGYYTEGWDQSLITLMTGASFRGYKLLGPYRHPYHCPNSTMTIDDLPNHKAVSTDAVQGLGHLMSWQTWDTYGPYDANAPGTNQSEDYALCRRIVEGGFRVGSIQPNVVYNCGITDSQGKPCIGIECMTERVEGVIYE